jgi:hypothetical protein
MIVYEADRTCVAEPILSGSGIVTAAMVGRVRVSLTWPVGHEQKLASWTSRPGAPLVRNDRLNRILRGTPDVAMAFGVPEPATSRRFANRRVVPQG